MALKYSNNATTTLGAAITSTSATSLTVASGTGALFPTLSGSDYFLVTLTNNSAMEIVKVTAVSGDVFTIVRGQESTTPNTFPVGATVGNFLTKGALDQIKADAITAALTGNQVQPYDSTILKSAAIGTTVQPYDSTILNSAAIGNTVQAHDADLDAIAALSGAGNLKRAANNTWSLDSGYYVPGDSATGAAQLPTGTTAQRPGTPAAGYIRYNATTGKFEGYGSAWGNIGGGAFIGDTAPANPGAGDLWWNSANGHTFVYYGSAWVDLFGGAEGQYLPLTGGTISGNLAYTGTLTGGTGVINIGSGQLYKDAAGNLGLGVTPSAWGSTYKAFQLGAQGSLAKNSGLELITLGLNYYRDASDITKYIASAAATQYTQYNGQHIWYTSPSGTAGNAISFTQAMTLDASGNLGIGTTSPGSPFEIVRNSSSGGSGLFPNIRLDNQNASGYTGLYFLNSGTQKAGLEVKNDVGALQFFTGSTERARIDSSGNLLVGTTSSSAGWKVKIGGTENHILLDGVTRFAQINYFLAGVYKAQTYYDGSTDRLYNQTGSTGGVYLANGGTSWTSASDERFKTDLKPIENAAQKVATLRAVTGRFKTDDEGVSRSFLIAQDVLAVLPEAVDASDPDKLGVQYTDTIPLLAAAINELSAKLEAIEARIH
jgi:hypothetical protein